MPSHTTPQELRATIADICRTGHYAIAETKVTNELLKLIEAEASRRSLALLDRIEAKIKEGGYEASYEISVVQEERQSLQERSTDE